MSVTETSNSAMSFSGSEAPSSSGLSNCDVSIFCHNSMSSEVKKSETILLEKYGITTSISCRDIPAGRGELSNLFSLAKHSELRVFLITEMFIKHDFEVHLRLLENPKVCSSRNSLLLLHKQSYRQRIPDYVGDLKWKCLNTRVTANDIVLQIIEFRNSLGSRSDNSEIDNSRSDDNECPPLTRHSLEKTKKERMAGYEKERARFKNFFGKITKKRCYVLISSPIRDCSPSLKFVACVPWTRVFDFDSDSATEGLYLWVEDDLSRKNLTKTTTIDQLEAPDVCTVNWVSVTAFADISESVETSHSKEVKVSDLSILRHGESLAYYCIGRKIPLILVMWYPSNSNLDKTLEAFISGLKHHLNARLQSFECIMCVNRMPSNRSPLYRMLERLRIVDNIIVAPIETLCDWIKECTEGVDEVGLALRSLRILPKSPESSEDKPTVEIPEEEFQWIRSHVHILEVYSDASRESNEDGALALLGESFLKGRTINWNVLEIEGYDVDRDLLNEVKSYIESKHIKTGRPGLITIYHAPGGGGTTFARRLLHELRNKVPCGELKSSKNLEDKLQSLRNYTFLPIVLLLDGNSMYDVKKILNITPSIRVILIHVRRDIRESRKCVSNANKFFLDAKLSATEAFKFSEIYSRAAPKNGTKLIKLTKNERPKYVFEYGMTAFQSKFVGVQKYVHGYLQLSHDGSALENWHIVLLYLSFANYYGHRGLPCKLFSKLLAKVENEIVDIDDLPHAARQFITEEDENWKITHYIVSKLIIEQILVRRETTDDFECPDASLSLEACRQLSKWALEFIINVTEYVGATQKLVPHMCEILTSVFIRRNYDDTEESSDSHKTYFAKIIEEVKNPKEQQKIFLKLVDSFPGHAEFRAHLGRYYSIRQGKFDKAEECFKHAIVVRKQELWGSENPYLRVTESVKPDDVIQRIYNMSGFACLSSIRKKIGVSIGGLSPRRLKNRNLPDLIKFCLEKANKAIKNFQDERLYYQKSSDPSFANIGELKARLQLSELAKNVEEDLNGLLSKKSPYKELADFAFHSFHECDKLLADCIADRSRDVNIPEDDIITCVNCFNFVFGNATDALEKWAAKDENSMRSLKCRLSILKERLKQENKVASAASCRRHFKLQDDVTTAEDISAIVQLYEKICERIFKSSVSVCTTPVSPYMTEWLKAIRHRYSTTEYTLFEVLSRVEKWTERNEKRSLSYFYCFVLSTTLAICSPSRQVASVHAEKSRKLKEAMKHKDNMQIYGNETSEWLGAKFDQNFNTLVHFTELGQWNGAFWSDPERVSKLQVCTGSIQVCHLHDGIIALDGGARIQAFFVPNKYKIGLSHSKKRSRVEFYLSFNTRHFVQAYEVRLLKKYPCPNPRCKRPTEITTLGKDPATTYAICCLCQTEVNIPQIPRMEGDTSDS